MRRNLLNEFSNGDTRETLFESRNGFTLPYTRRWLINLLSRVQTGKELWLESHMYLAMNQRQPHGGIGRESIEVVRCSDRSNNPLLSTVTGMISFDDGGNWEFVSDIEKIEQGREYEAVYEFTTTMTDDTVINILEIKEGSK